MLVSLVVRFKEDGERDFDRYEAWVASLLRLRGAFKKAERIKIHQLRDYLECISEKQQSDTLQDLIAEHLALTWREKPGECLEAYFAEFGGEFEQLRSPSTVPADLVEDEFLARYQVPHGDTPPLEEYRQRFPKRTDIIECLGKRSLDKGHYIKLKKIGHGAMGDVWKAYDCRLNKLIAIKQANSDSADIDTILHDLAEESNITSELEHPGINTLRALQQEDRAAAPLYGMELVDGQSLAQAIGKYHTPSELLGKSARRQLMQRLLQVLVDVGEALEYAHNKGVLHCDLKPGNILLDENDHPAIIDWGMARTVTATSRPTASPDTLIAGTPEYMPPEQADGHADTRSDVFGLGAILYEILTGSPPHSWDNKIPPNDWVHQVRQAGITPPRQLNPKISAPLNAICSKALAPNPDDRHQSAAEFASELKPLVKNSQSAPLLSKVCHWLGGGGG